MRQSIIVLLIIVLLLGVGIVGFFYLMKAHRKSSQKSVENDFDKIHFSLVFGKHPTLNYSRYNVADYLELVKDKNFLKDRKTILYTHGWIENYYSESVETIAAAFSTRDDYNIVVMDWGYYSFGEYFSVIPRFVKIAKPLAKIIFDWHSNGLNLEKLHCIGHSFGSHLFGIMGREFIKISNGRKIPRITGLDPAHYGFFPRPLFASPLSKNDAVFVDAIHSDVNVLGTRNICGHVDFFPNNAALQPGCPKIGFKNYTQFINNFCSHQHSWRYYAETVMPHQEKIFPALRCDSYSNFLNGTCEGNSMNFMGLGVISNLEGSFYNELKSNFHFDVDESYYLYLSTSFNYRSDLVKFLQRVSNFYNKIRRS